MAEAPLTIEEGIVLRMVEREQSQGTATILPRDHYARVAHRLMDQGLLSHEGVGKFALTDAGRTALRQVPL